MDALSYLREVKEHFKFNKAVYDIFLDIMKEFKARRIDTADVIRRVKELFKGHNRLILGFNTFVPKGYEIKLDDLPSEGPSGSQQQAPPAAQASQKPSSSQQQQQQQQQQGENKGKRPVEYDQAFNYVNKIRTRFRYDERIYNAFLEILNMYRKGQKTISQVYSEVATLFKDHSDLLEEFEYFLPDNTAPGGGGVTMQQTQANLAKAAQNKAAAAAAAQRRKQGGAGPGGLQGDGVRRQINKRKSARRADELIRRQSQGESDLNADASEDRKPDSKSTKPANLGKELQFFEKVKNRIRNREAYQELLKCLNIYNQEIINKHELQSLVHDILGRCPDLVNGFNEFLSRCEAMDIDLGEASRGKDGKLSMKDVQKMKQVISAREKFNSRPISELDLSMCERCGPSYRLLPKNYPKVICSDRTPLCHEVLNDTWVNVTSGSEDYSFKQMRKNQYEESLFRCEDDRFELDMIIETNESCFKVLQPLMDKLEEMSPEDKASFRLPEEMLTPVHLRCVERIYGEQGPDIRDLMIKNPAVAIPVVMTRLRQKDDEWRKCREQMNKVWAEVYEKNYQKSLDHRSFYFKQMDKKSTSSKGIIAEIREVSEKRKREEEGIIVAAAANQRPLCPDLQFECNTNLVHDDVFKILKFSIGEYVQSADQGEKLLSFFRHFLEPFMGLEVREDAGFEDKKDNEEDDEDDIEGEEGEKKKAESKENGMDEDGDATAAAAAAATTKEDSIMVEGVECAVKQEEEEAAEKPEVDMAEAEAEEGEIEEGELAIDEEEKEEEEKEEEEEEAEEMELNHKCVEAKQLDEEVSFRGCKPLASYPEMDGSAAEAGPVSAAAAQSARPSGPAVFYAHDALYSFFRLHQHLFERVTIAHQEAANMQAKKEAEAKANGSPPPAEGEVLGTFFTMLYKLLEGNLESSRYEDECRALLGNNAYMLFTLDKLLLKLMKQLQALQNDDLSMKLRALYAYEKSRGTAFRDDVYHANACVLLHEETCYRIEYGEGQMSLQLMEGGLDKSELSVGAMDSTFAEYLYLFLQSQASRDDKRGVFLTRNLRNGGEKEEESLVEVCVYNGLECKISCNTSKVSYVLDTEDLFHRRRRGAKAKAVRLVNEGKPTPKELMAVERFHSMLEKHAAVSSAEVEEQKPEMVA